ncbi:MAG: hypothetical protein B7Z66_15535, partial [Chromatiales bacterium 21-64-14]
SQETARSWAWAWDCVLAIKHHPDVRGPRGLYNQMYCGALSKVSDADANIGKGRVSNEMTATSIVALLNGVDGNVDAFEHWCKFRPLSSNELVRFLVLAGIAALKTRIDMPMQLRVHVMSCIERLDAGGPASSTRTFARIQRRIDTVANRIRADEARRIELAHAEVTELNNRRLIGESESESESDNPNVVNVECAECPVCYGRRIDGVGSNNCIHTVCLGCYVAWARNCRATGRDPTCPMCRKPF